MRPITDRTVRCTRPARTPGMLTGMLLLLAALLTGWSAQAAESPAASGDGASTTPDSASTTPDSASTTPDSASTTPDGAPSGTNGERKTDQDDASADVFIPTEEISEDFAVAFPVDI